MLRVKKENIFFNIFSVLDKVKLNTESQRKLKLF